MSNPFASNMICRPETTDGGVIRVERVWHHRHDLEIGRPKPRRNRRRLIALGAGGLLLVTACVFTYSDQVPTRDTAGPMTRYHMAQQDPAVSTKVPDSVDTPPAPISIANAPLAPAAFTVIPTRRPVASSTRSARPQKTDLALDAANSAPIRHSDQCNPDCATREPQIVSPVPAVVVPPLAMTMMVKSAPPGGRDRALEVGALALNGAGHVLLKTAVLPFTTLKLGRDAVIKISGID